VPESNTLPAARQTDAPDISIIIVSWNVREHLHRCLEALLSTSVTDGLTLEVIVVDNNSSDGSADSLQGLPVCLIRNDRNLGYGGANNQGLRRATGNYLLVLNPDTVPIPGSLSALLAFGKAHPRAGIVAPRLLNADGTVQRSAFRFPTILMAALDLFPLPHIVPGRIRACLATSRLNGRYPSEPHRTRPFRIEHPLGACMLISRPAYEQCGGFDEKIHMYSEEIDLAIRYARAGWQCWQVPSARVVHLGGQSTSQVPDRMFTELWRSRLYLYSKHYSLASQVVLSSLVTLWALKERLAARASALLRSQPTAEVSRRKHRATSLLRVVFDK
jgi:N-acetylglucosaminyl-diphospho-decaprenol L-rhamnosyltransferase